MTTREDFEVKHPPMAHWKFVPEKNRYTLREECDASHQPGAALFLNDYNNFWNGYQSHAAQSQQVIQDRAEVLRECYYICERNSAKGLDAGDCADDISALIEGAGK